MGKTLKLFVLLLVLCFFAALQGREIQRPLFAPVEVGFKLIQAPRVKAGAVSSVTRGSVVLANRRWGMVEITYRPRYDFESRKGSSRKSIASNVWLDDVICGVRVILCDRQNRRDPALALFSTKVEFWTIPLDFRDHKYFVYIPPMLIERVMPPRRPDSRTVRLASEADFIVCVTFFHKKWGLLGEGFFGLRGRSAAADFQELLKMAPAANTFHGSLVSRANSPWGLNDQNQFDLEKPAFIPAPLDEAAIEKAAAKAVAEEAGSADKTRKSSRSANSRRNKKSRR